MKEMIKKYVASVVCTLATLLITGSALAVDAPVPAALWDGFNELTVNGYTWTKASTATINADGSLTVGSDGGLSMTFTSGNIYNNREVTLIIDMEAPSFSSRSALMSIRTNNNDVSLSANGNTLGECWNADSTYQASTTDWTPTARQVIALVYKGGGNEPLKGTRTCINGVSKMYKSGCMTGSNKLNNLYIGIRNGVNEPATGLKVYRAALFDHTLTQDEVAAFAFPPIPTAMWQYEELENPQAKGDYTLTVTGNTFSDDAITIGDSGLIIGKTSGDFALEGTVIIDVDSIPNKADATLISYVIGNNANEVTVDAINGTSLAHKWNHSGSYGSADCFPTTRSTVALAYKKADGNNAEVTYVNGEAKFTGSAYSSTEVSKIRIGSDKGVNTTYGAQGMKVYGVAYFKTKLYAAEVAAYKFPVPPTRVSGNKTWSGLWAGKEEPTSDVVLEFESGAVLTIDKDIACPSIEVTGSNGATIKHIALPTYTNWKFDGLQGSITFDLSAVPVKDLTKYAVAGAPYSVWLVHGTVAETPTVTLPTAPSGYTFTTEPSSYGVRVVVTAPNTAKNGAVSINVQTETSVDLSASASYGLYPEAGSEWGFVNGASAVTHKNVTFTPYANSGTFATENGVTVDDQTAATRIMRGLAKDVSDNRTIGFDVTGVDNLVGEGGKCRVIVYLATDTANVYFAPVVINGVTYTGPTEGQNQLGYTIKDSTLNRWGAAAGNHATHPVTEGVNAVISDVIDVTSDPITIRATRQYGSYATRASISAVQIVKVGAIAAKIGDKTYGSLAEAEAAVTSGQTITLLAPLSEDLATAKTFTLDFNGNAYSGTLTVNEGGNVTLSGETTSTLAGAIAIDEDAVVTVSATLTKDLNRKLLSMTSGEGTLKIPVNQTLEIQIYTDNTAITANVNVDYTGSGELQFVGSNRTNTDKFTVSTGKTVTFDGGTFWNKRGYVYVDGVLSAKNIKSGHESNGNYPGNFYISNGGTLETESITFSNGGGSDTEANRSTIEIGGTLEITGSGTAIAKTSGAKNNLKFNGGTIIAKESSWSTADLNLTFVDGTITTFDVASGKEITLNGTATGSGTITKTGAGMLNLPSSYTNMVTLEGGALNGGFTGDVEITGALDLTNVTSFPIGGTVVATGNTGSIKLPASFVDGKIVKFAGDDIVASGLTVFDSTGTDITDKLQIVDGHIAMVAQEITATLDGSYYPDWKELPWDGERTWSDGLKAILTIASENVYIMVPEAVSASIVLKGTGNVSFTCAENLVCDAIDATELEGTISFSSSNVTTIRAGDNNVDYAYTGNAHVALNIETTGAIKVENTTEALVDINAGASDLTYKYTGNTPIAPSISTTGNFTKEGAGTITGLNFGTAYAGQVTINAGMISSDYLSFGATPHVTIAAGATWQNTHDNVSLQDQARDYSNVTGSGRLEFKSLSTAANAWRAIPVSMDKMWAQSLEFVVSEKDGAILSGVGVDYVMGSLSGDCKLRYDFSSGTRSLKVVQSRDTTWNGTFLSSYNERFSTFTVDGTGSDSHVLTLAGTFDNSHPLVVTANGAVKVTGAWQGNVTVNGEFGGSGQVKNATEITFVDGAKVRADWGMFTLNVAPTFGGTLNVTLPENETAAGYKILTLTNAAEKYINVAVKVEGDEKDYILEQKADGIYLVEKGANGVVITVPENEEVTKTLATGLNYEKTGLGTLLVKGTIEGTLTISAGEAVIMPGASVGTIVTMGTGKDLYGYTVNVNNCGKFAIPSGKTADKIRIFDAAGNPLDITDSDERYVYFDWEITDDACWWDYEFNGNVNNTGTEGTALRWDNDRPGGADFTDDGKLYAVKRPWRDVSTWPSVATFVMYGTMPSNDNRYYVVFGSTTHGSNNAIFLATDKVSEDKVVLCSANERSGDKDHLIKLCTMTVPNAQSADHLYAFVLKSNDTRTIIDIYLDGELLQSYPFGEVINLGPGFQFASPHGGEVVGYSRPENTDQATLDWLRVYDLELTKEALEKYAEEYPYVSPNGSYQRTVMADANWSETDAWTEEGTEPAEKADEPAAGATAKLAIDNKDATTTIAINLADDVTYEAIQINGDDVKFVLAEGVDFGGIVKSTGRVTANANITFAYDAFSMENAPLTVKQGKTVTFDLSMVDMTQFFSTQTYELTGYLTLEEDAAVTFIVPSELHGRTASAAIDPITRHYVLTITAPDNPFTYTDGAWTWGTQSVTTEIVSANPGTAVTVASGTLEWPMDRASFTVNGGSLKATAAPTAACAIAVNAGAAFDVNGKGSTQYAITLNGGEIANTGNGTFVTGLTVTDDSSVNLTGNLSIQSSATGWDPTTIALGENTLTKKGDGQFTLVMTTITGAGTLDIQSGKVYSSESTTFADGTIKIASGAIYQQRGGGDRTTTVAKIIGVEGAILQNNNTEGAGTMSAFTLKGALKLDGAGTFGVITLDDATLDLDTVRGLTVAGTGSVKATITAAEQTSGSFTLFTKTEDAKISSVTLVDEAGETLTPSSADFDDDGNYVVAFSVAITAQPIANTYAESVTWGDGTQTTTFVNNVAMIPAGATNVKVQFRVLDLEYTFSTGSQVYEVELGTVTSATTATIPAGVTVGPIVAMVGDYPNTKFYPSLALAIAAVEDGETISMFASDENETTITKSVTIEVGTYGSTPNSINVNATAGTGVTINFKKGGVVTGTIAVNGGTVNFQTAGDNVGGNFTGTLTYSSGTVTRNADYAVTAPEGYLWYGTNPLTLISSEFTWIGASGDNWNDPTKWQGAVVPVAGAKAIINLGDNAGDYTINLPEATAALASLTLSGSATSFAFTGTGSLSATSYNISGLTAATIDLSKTTFNADYTIPANSTLVVNGATWTSAATFGATTSKIRYDGAYTAIGGTFAGEKGTVEIGGTLAADGNITLGSTTVQYAFDGNITVNGVLTVGSLNGSVAYFNRGTINATTFRFGGAGSGVGAQEQYFLGDGASDNDTMVITANTVDFTTGNNSTGLRVYFRRGSTVKIGAGGMSKDGNNPFYRNWFLQGGKIVITDTCSMLLRELKEVINETELEVMDGKTLTLTIYPFENGMTRSGSVRKTGTGSIVFASDPAASFTIAGGDATIAAGLESRITVVEGGTLKLKVTDAQWITGYTSTATIPDGADIVFIAPDGTVIPGTSGKDLPPKAANKTWVGGTTGEWNVAANWNPSGVPSATDTVKIESATDAITITLPTDAVTAVNGATFMGDDDITLVGGAFTPGAFAKLGAGTVTMTLGADIAQSINIIEGTLALEIPTETPRTISGVISGAGSLVKTGAGTLTLSGANTFAGGTTVEAGVIVRGNGSAFGASMSTIDVKSGAALNWGDTATRNDSALYRVKLAGVGVGDGKGAFYTSTNNNTLSAGNRHPISLELTDNASIGGEQDFGVMYYRNGYSVATVNLNGHTLTKVGTGTFYTSKIEFSNGTVVVDNGTLNVINNSDNETFHSDAKLVVGANGKLNAFNNSFTVYDVEFTAAENEIKNETGGGKFVVKGTVVGSFSTAKLDFGDGATIKKVGDTVASINVTEALTLIGTINLDVTGETAEKLPVGTKIDVFTTTNEITEDNIGDIIAASEQNFQPYVKVSEGDTPVYTVGVMATYEAEVTWDGTSGNWTATSFNGIPGNYGDDQQTAIFTDAASGTDAITVTVVEGPRTVKGISFDAERNITIDGSVVVNGAITKDGAGRAEITGTTTVSGAISVTEGTLAINFAADYAQAISVNGVLEVNVPANTTRVLSGEITGSGTIVKSGEGALHINRANNTGFTGSWDVQGGDLKGLAEKWYGVDNNNTPIVLTVNDGATLHLANMGDCAYSLVCNGGTVNNDGNVTGTRYTTGCRQAKNITINGDTTFTGNQFGLLASGYNPTTMTFYDNATLTISMNANSAFFMTATTVSGAGTIKVAQGIFSSANNTGAAPVINEGVKVVVDGGTLKADKNTLTIHTLEYVSGSFTSANNAAVKVTGTLSGSSTIPRLTLGNGATIPVTSEITVSSALALDDTINIDLGTTGSGNFHVITAPNGYEWDTTKVTLVGSDLTDWNVSAEGTTLVVSKLPLDAMVDEDDGYNFDEKVIKVDVTKIDSTLKGTQIKVVTTDKNGGDVSTTLVQIDGSKGMYDVVIGGLTAGETYNFNVTFVDSKGDQIDQSKEADLKNIAVGTLIEGEDIFSADATSGESDVDGGEWDEEHTPTIPEGENYYQIVDDVESIFNVEKTAPDGSNFTVEYDLSFEPGFATELMAEATAPIAGLTIGAGDTDETTNWYRADSTAETGWSKLDQDVTPGHYIIRMAFTATTVTYSVKGDEDTDFVTLTQNETTSAFEISSSAISSVSFQGSSSLAKFGAKTDDTIDTAIANDGEKDLTTIEGVLASLAAGKTVTLKTNVAIDTSSLTAGESYNITADGFNLRWDDERIVSYDDKTGAFTITAEKPENGFTSFENYALNLDPEDENSKPIGVAPADNGKLNTLTVEIKNPKGGELLVRDGYAIKCIATPKDGGKEVVSTNLKQIDLPLPESGEVQYTIKIEVIKE